MRSRTLWAASWERVGSRNVKKWHHGHPWGDPDRRATCDVVVSMGPQRSLDEPKSIFNINDVDFGVILVASLGEKCGKVFDAKSDAEKTRNSMKFQANLMSKTRRIS